MGASSNTVVTLPDSNYCPPGNLFYNIVAWIAGHISTSTTLDAGTGVQIYRQPNVPAPTPNTVWHRIGDAAGVNDPQGEYVYFNGRFVPNPTGRRIGDYMFTDFDPNGYIDANGKGLFVPVSPAADTPNIAGPLFGWQLCNGNNGSQNMKGRFLMGGYQYTEGVGWVANLLNTDGTRSDSDSGGREGITLMQNATTNNLPSLVTADYDASGNASTSVIYAGNKYTAATSLTNPGIKSQDAIRPILPLYRACGLFQWIGYAAASAS